jgi:amidohydrolase
VTAFKENILERAGRLSDELIQWRRRIHESPELSFQEYRTAQFVAETLRKIKGMDVRTAVGNTGVVGSMTYGNGPTIAIRADMDALPILEETNHSFLSKIEGVMHACGHDAHTAILLGVAHLLSESFQSGKVQGTVKFLFQPAEETTDEAGLSGAPYMIKDGALEDVDAVIALHMCPWLPVGEIQIHDDYSMANVDSFQGKIVGTGGHGGYPHLATDPIYMLSLVLQSLNGIVSRKVSPLDAGVVSIGQIHAGTASNIIPTEVLIEGTMRSYKPDVRDFLNTEIEKSFSLVEPMGGRYSLDIVRGEPALRNHPVLNQWIMETMKDLYPDFKITIGPFGLGGEDFGYMTEVIPGSMFFLGCGFRDGIQRNLHTPIFDLDETCLPVGAAILAETARRYLTGAYQFLNDNRNPIWRCPS